MKNEELKVFSVFLLLSSQELEEISIFVPAKCNVNDERRRFNEW